MGPRRIPLIALVLILVWRITFGQLSRMRGFNTFYGSSESPCGPGVQQQQFRQQPYQPAASFNRRGSTGFNPLGRSFGPYQAAMLDIDIPPHMFGGGMPFMGFQQQQRFYPSHSGSRSPSFSRQRASSYPRQRTPTFTRTQSTTYAREPLYPSQSPNTYGRQPSAYTSRAVSSYPVHVSGRRVKRQVMMSRMNCQCDSATDCNMYATIAGRSYNSQCSSRLGLVCCCRGA